MIDEINKSINTTLYERLASPLLGSFIASWCIWNYKFFLIIFSPLEYDKQVVKLDAYFAEWYYCRSLSLPLLWVLFYIFIYPCIAKYVFKKWQKYISDKERIRQNVKRETPITHIQANEIRQNLAKQSVEFENRLQDKNERIKVLETLDNNNINRLGEKEKELEKLKEQFKKMTEDLAVFINREKWIDEFEITPTSEGLLYSNGGKYTGKYLCPTCLYSSPPKLIQIPESAPSGQQFIKCPSCSGEYANHKYDQERSFNMPHVVDSDYSCWLNGKNKHCPACAIKFNNFKFSELAKISEDEYRCVLCSKSYKKSSTIQNI